MALLVLGLAAGTVRAARLEVEFPIMSIAYKRKMARPEGFEPPTPRFEAWYSIRLSYGRLNIGRGDVPAVSRGIVHPDELRIAHGHCPARSGVRVSHPQPILVDLAHARAVE